MGDEVDGMLMGTGKEKSLFFSWKEGFVDHNNSLFSQLSEAGRYLGNR